MGRDKATLTAPSGATLVEYVSARLAKISSIVALSAAKPFGALPHIPDLRRNIGPCAGIEAALHWAEQHRAATLVTWPVDSPLMPLAWLDELASAVERGETGSCYVSAILADGHERSQPLCAAWSLSKLDAVCSYLDTESHPSVYGLHERLKSKVLDAGRWCSDLTERERAMLNVNTPDDYRRMLAAWR